MPGPVYEMPIHHQPVFGGAYGGLSFAEAESFSYGHLCLPPCPTITEEEQITVAAAIVEAAEAALLGR